MLNKQSNIFLITTVICCMFSCSTKNISTNYYYQHEKVLDQIEESYKALYQRSPFSIAFTDRDYNTVSLEIITDTLSYIYEFEIKEPRLADTLLKFNLNAEKIVALIQQMQNIKCTWINNYNYYVDEKKNSLIFMSIKAKPLNSPFSYKKYYILTYFPQPQYFDNEGRLLDKRKLRRLREINGEIFKRINDRVCYTISGKFR